MPRAWASLKMMTIQREKQEMSWPIALAWNIIKFSYVAMSKKMSDLGNVYLVTKGQSRLVTDFHLYSKWVYITLHISLRERTTQMDPHGEVLQWIYIYIYIFINPKKLLFYIVCMYAEIIEILNYWYNYNIDISQFVKPEPTTHPTLPTIVLIWTC